MTSPHYTFIRSATNWEEFSSAEKITQETGLTETEARKACKEFNMDRTQAQIDAGTKMEFDVE